MCYNNCSFENYNAGSGNCTCNRGKYPCPEELEYCTLCAMVMSEEEVIDSAEKTDSAHQLCKGCLTNYLDDLTYSCPYCEHEFIPQEKESTTCPKCKATVQL